ncbi:MAG: Dabb family protein [Bacteroidales bacterium]|nr:Dabb family protein [Bacteroides sp.]MCM1197731.1 Dabb family protein [Clostridium sp.]MCM1501762.1 Dabb family protein [Bacteroidales bacterium]
MIRHIVMWKFREDIPGMTPKEAAEEAKANLEALTGKIPGLLHIEVGVNAKASKGSYDAALTADFESWDALDAYRVHPLHVPISQHCESIRESRTCVDYEL